MELEFISMSFDPEILFNIIKLKKELFAMFLRN